MALFSEYFQLGKSQYELDFVNVPVDSDILLFVDPFAMSQRLEPWSQQCHLTLISFFQRIVDAIRSGNTQLALELLRFLREPNETRLGFSRNQPQGAGIGYYQAEQLFDALSESSAVRTGFISSLEECEILIQGVSRDKISDLTTNIIRKNLAEYTKEQCILHNIPIRQVPLRPYYSTDTGTWISDYFEIPIAMGQPVLLVPKAIVRYDPAYDHQNYYSNFVLSYLQAEHINANSSLVYTLKNGTKVVHKKDVAKTLPCTKENLYRFSRDHPEVLEKYRDHLVQLERRGREYVVGKEDEKMIALALVDALKSIQPGNDSAGEYHRLMIGVVEFLFFPSLLCPMKEREIHEGRKRIDIVMENGARDGIFYRLHDVRKLPCAYVVFECKNYGRDVSNPELDQIAGRFSTNRGLFGILCCRGFQDRQIFIKRCRDTFTDGRGLVVPIDDETIIQWLLLISEDQRNRIDEHITQLINEVWLN